MERRSRKRATGVVGLLAAALITGFVTPADAAESPDSMNHAMGSQIRLHESTADQPDGVGGLSRSARLAASVEGIDISSYQAGINLQAQYNAGRRFVWIKSTEGTGYASPEFSSQYSAATKAGMLRGAYHFARPNLSSGATQAQYFSAHGGGWSGDGHTLPGALDIEYAPSGNTCYGMSKAALINWVKSFSDTYKARWKKYPAIYTTAGWWNQCVGGDFHTTNPLWLAYYASTSGPMPYNWSAQTVWQYSSSGNLDKNRFNGSYDRLKIFATNHD